MKSLNGTRFDRLLRGSDARRPNAAPRGFTLAELIIAILVLGMGLVMLAAVFPAGIAQQQFANDDVYGRVVADHALSVIRAKVKPDDFGTYEQFYLRDARPTGAGGAPERPHRTVGSADGSTPDLFGVAGDWGWKRPGFVFDDPTTPFDEGKVDIFSWDATFAAHGPVPQQTTHPTLPLLAVDTSLGRATEFPAGRNPSSPLEQALGSYAPPGGTHTLFGIPFNREKYDSDLNLLSVETEVVGFAAADGSPVRRPKVPAAYIMQHERTWPQGAGTRTSPAQYYWDCLFRRFEGRIYVAIFVYRVAPPGGEPRPYSTARASVNPAVLGQPQGNANLPPLPVTLRLDNAANQGGSQFTWGVVGSDGTQIFPPKDIPSSATGATDTGAGSAFRPDSQCDAWQLPGQWIFDRFGNVHRVIGGRRQQSNGPVRFAQPMTTAPRNPAVVGGFPDAGSSTPSVPGSPNIDQIWFLPGRDANGNTLIPVFCTVQEL